MFQHQKESLINRIISGRIRLKINNKFGVEEIIYYKTPSVTDRILADELYADLLDKYSGELLDEDDLELYLIKNRVWSYDNEDLITKLSKDIETFKVRAFESFFQSDIRKLAKKSIVTAKNKILELLSIKNKYAHLTASGTAALEKIKFLTAASLYDSNGRRIFKRKDFEKSNNPILEQSISCLNKLRLTEEQYRLLARTEPWRGYWCIRESCAGIFNKPAVELSDEQKELANWSILYDSIYSHPDCPCDEIINDDDCLDGFLISDKKKRDAEKLQHQTDDKIKNSKIANADEVFLPASNIEDAAKIDLLNSDMNRARKRAREKVISEKGVVNEQNLPDVKQKLIMDLNNLAREKMKGR